LHEKEDTLAKINQELENLNQYKVRAITFVTIDLHGGFTKTKKYSILISIRFKEPPSLFRSMGSTVVEHPIKFCPS